jgi:hypothetical protein
VTRKLPTFGPILQKTWADLAKNMVGNTGMVDMHFLSSMSNPKFDIWSGQLLQKATMWGNCGKLTNIFGMQIE